MATERNITQPFVLVHRYNGREHYIGIDTREISWDETRYEKRSAAPTERQQLLDKIVNKG